MTLDQTHDTKAADWRETVEDPDERKVLDALSDERWDFRTVSSIADSAGLPEHRVAELLGHSDFVRVSDAPGPDATPLYTLKSRGVTAREELAAAQAVISKSNVL